MQGARPLEYFVNRALSSKPVMVAYSLDSMLYLVIW